ncbi:MAG: hypothetical protein AMXMBFR20_00930 [Planctomycetia bacterium]
MIPVSSDWTDLLSLLNAARARYLIVGAHAVSHHGNPRFTADFDVWVDSGKNNAEKVFRALVKFGAPLHTFTLDDLAKPDVVIQIGVEPFRIDIITSVDGLNFADSWTTRSAGSFAGVPAAFISRTDLIKNKRASGRPQDLLDVESLLRKKPSPVRRRKK